MLEGIIERCVWIGYELKGLIMQEEEWKAGKAEAVDDADFCGWAVWSGVGRGGDRNRGVYDLHSVGNLCRNGEEFWGAGLVSYAYSWREVTNLRFWCAILAFQSIDSVLYHFQTTLRIENKVWQKRQVNSKRFKYVFIKRKTKFYKRSNNNYMTQY